jgi:hypothetical protein
VDENQTQEIASIRNFGVAMLDQELLVILRELFPVGRQQRLDRFPIIQNPMSHPQLQITIGIACQINC